MPKKNKSNSNQNKSNTNISSDKEPSSKRIDGKYYPLVSVCTPTFNRRPFIPIMFQCFRNQTYPTSCIEWIIVDDGSIDGTSEILDIRTAQTSWITVIHRENRGFRAAGSGVMEAFYAGYSILNDENWDFIVKLDGDLSFPPDYFEQCFKIFKLINHISCK